MSARGIYALRALAAAGLIPVLHSSMSGHVGLGWGFFGTAVLLLAAVGAVGSPVGGGRRRRPRAALLSRGTQAWLVALLLLLAATASTLGGSPPAPGPGPWGMVLPIAAFVYSDVWVGLWQRLRAAPSPGRSPAGE